MTDFFVLGATGRTGAAFSRQALAMGHRVSALVRGSSAGIADGVTPIAGDVLGGPAVRAAIREHHVMVVALSGPAVGPGSANVIRAASEVGARRLLGVVGA